MSYLCPNCGPIPGINTELDEERNEEACSSCGAPEAEMKPLVDAYKQLQSLYESEKARRREIDDEAFEYAEQVEQLEARCAELEAANGQLQEAVRANSEYENEQTVKIHRLEKDNADIRRQYIQKTDALKADKAQQQERIAQFLRSLDTLQYWKQSNPSPQEMADTLEAMNAMAHMLIPASYTPSQPTPPTSGGE